MPLSITKDNYDEEMRKHDKPVIMEIYASWCGPCKLMAPIFEELEQEMGEGFRFLKLNVDEARDISIQLGITSVPTFLFIKNGHIKGKELGYASKNALKEKIKKYLM